MTRRAIVFDGRKFSNLKEGEIKEQTSLLKKKGITPKLISIFAGSNMASKCYLALKRSAAERIGAKVVIRYLHDKVKTEKITDLIDKLNHDNSVHGIMIQLPLPNHLKHNSERIFNSINPKKDVDGMRDDSLFITPAVKAVIAVIKEASFGRFRTFRGSEPDIKVIVIGAKGFIGRKLVKTLGEIGYDVTGFDLEERNLANKAKNADILISATGQKGIIAGKMIKDKAVIIDVGAPNGDVVFDEAVRKASFITPVPGGIGPVTISCLLENLVEVAERLHKRA